MKKPATEKLFALRAKLQALALAGVNGEKIAAELKLKRLEQAIDFSKPVMRTEDIFANFKPRPSCYATPIMPFNQEDYDIATAVKDAIRQATTIECVFRAGPELWAQVDPSAAKRLAEISRTVSESFRQLWQQFSRAPGIESQDRSIFIAGLADGMSQDVRTGQLLPALPKRSVKVRAKKKAVAPPIGLNSHPYSIAAKLGEQIRFSVPLEEVSNQLANTITKPKEIE